MARDKRLIAAFLLPLTVVHSFLLWVFLTRAFKPLLLWVVEIVLPWRILPNRPGGQKLLGWKFAAFPTVYSLKLHRKVAVFSAKLYRCHELFGVQQVNKKSPAEEAKVLGYSNCFTSISVLFLSLSLLSFKTQTHVVVARRRLMTTLPEGNGKSSCSDAL